VSTVTPNVLRASSFAFGREARVQGRFGKDRSPRKSSHFIAGVKYASPPIAEVPVRLLSGLPPTIGGDRYGCYTGAPVVLV
jgi:hypothetical protein